MVVVAAVVVVVAASVAFEIVEDLHWPWYFGTHHPRQYPDTNDD